MQSIRWTDQQLHLLNQLRLPGEELWESYETYEEVVAAIQEMKVRGAPAIAAAAAFGVVLAAQNARDEDFFQCLDEALSQLGNARPTAVNLSWAMGRMNQILIHAKKNKYSRAQTTADLEVEARKIFEEDIATNKAIGEYGADLFDTRLSILTHCNTGALATAGYGTALGVVRSLHTRKQLRQVFVDETRPYLQGARLTAYELTADEIPHVLITDSMAGFYMQQGEVNAVLVGADRIAANGDTANKIGTYSLAVLAAHHKIPFYVAAPVSSFDLSMPSGREIPIEERSEEEVKSVFGRAVAPSGTKALHPAFDVTPASLIAGIVTERGVIHNPSQERVRAVINGE